MKRSQVKLASKKPEEQPPKQQIINFKLVTLLLFLVVLALGVTQFINRGGSDHIKRIYYGHVVRQGYHREYKNLMPALETLGLSENKEIKSICEKEEIALDGTNVSEVLFCGLQTDNYVRFTEANKQEILRAAKQLDELTGTNGGKVQTNIDTTFSKYFTDISNGVDYHPDFGATFVRENYLCAVHLNIAFSNASGPAYSIQFGCNAPRVTSEDYYLLPPCLSNCDE